MNNSLAKLMLGAAIAGLVSGTTLQQANANTDKAKEAKTSTTKAKKDSCKGHDGCKSKDAAKAKDSCKSKDSCKGKDTTKAKNAKDSKAKHSCKGKDGCKSH